MTRLDVDNIISRGEDEIASRHKLRWAQRKLIKISMQLKTINIKLLNHLATMHTTDNDIIT